MCAGKANPSGEAWFTTKIRPPNQAETIWTPWKGATPDQSSTRRPKSQAWQVTATWQAWHLRFWIFLWGQHEWESEPMTMCVKLFMKIKMKHSNPQTSLPNLWDWVSCPLGWAVLLTTGRPAIQVCTHTPWHLHQQLTPLQSGTCTL